MPLGYRIDSEHHYQIDPATAPVVQEAFQRYAAGESIRSIIESLNARGIPNSRGNRFTKNSFQTLLKNRRYLGEYRYKDTVILMLYRPSSTRSVSMRSSAGARFTVRHRPTTRQMSTICLPPSLFCGKCGTMMAGRAAEATQARSTVATINAAPANAAARKLAA